MLHWSTRKSPLETSPSTEAFSSVGDCPCQYTPDAFALQLRGAETSSQATAVTTAGTEVCLSITDAKLLPGSLACGAESHSNYGDAFVHGWMPNYCC